MELGSRWCEARFRLSAFGNKKCGIRDGVTTTGVFVCGGEPNSSGASLFMYSRVFGVSGGETFPLLVFMKMKFHGKKLVTIKDN